MSDANSKRAVAYLRVSSISQVDGHSLNAQERLFNQLCESRGWAAVRVYREECEWRRDNVPAGRLKS